MKTGALVAAAIAAWVMTSAAAADPVKVPLDGESVVNGVAVACTGVGQTKLDPKWASYPVRIEFADAQSALLGDVTLALSGADGHPMLEVGCEGPWLLFKLPPGRYHIEGGLSVGGVKPQTATITAPAKGQMRLVLRFPDA